jgi:hypothetical protein
MYIVHMCIFLFSFINNIFIKFIYIQYIYQIHFFLDMLMIF